MSLRKRRHRSPGCIPIHLPYTRQSGERRVCRVGEEPDEEFAGAKAKLLGARQLAVEDCGMADTFACFATP
jgi:hypothetical protein